MPLTRTDVYVTGVMLATAWFFWRLIEFITLGAGFALIGSATLLGWSTIALLVASAYCSMTLFLDGITYVRAALSGDKSPDTALGEHVTHLLALVVILGALLIVQAVWYAQHGY